MAEFGYPPKFPEIEETDVDIEEEVSDPADPTKRIKKVKSKVAAKGGGASYQWTIMKGLGLADEEIKKFADPLHWMSYFPPLARSDLQALGCRVSAQVWMMMEWSLVVLWGLTINCLYRLEMYM